MIVFRIAVSQPKRHQHVVEVLLEKHIICCPAGTCLDPQFVSYSRDDLTHQPDLSQAAVDYLVSAAIIRQVQDVSEYHQVGALARADSRDDSRLAEHLERLPEQDPLF